MSTKVRYILHLESAVLLIKGAYHPPDVGRSTVNSSHGTPYDMKAAVSAPHGNPKDSNLIQDDCSSFLTHEVSTNPPEFPVRTSFGRSGSSISVFTNHFAMTITEGKPLYDYGIQGIPDKLGRKATRALVENMIEANGTLRTNKANFATDYRERIVSWVDLTEESLKPILVSSKENREKMSLNLSKPMEVDISALKRFVKGEGGSDKVRASRPRP